MPGNYPLDQASQDSDRLIPDLRVGKNERLRKAVSDLTLEKLILREAASGNF